MNTQLSIAAEQVKSFIETLPVNFLHVGFETEKNFVVAFGKSVLVSVSHRSGRFLVVSHNQAYEGKRVKEAFTEKEIIDAVAEIISSK